MPIGLLIMWLFASWGRKAKIIITIIVFIPFLGLLSFYYLLISQHRVIEKQTEKKFNVTHVAGVKTLINSKYGYSFSYPSRLILPLQGGLDLVEVKDISNIFNMYSIYISAGGINIKQLSLEKILEEHVSYSGFPSISYSPIKRDEIAIAGLRAIREMGIVSSSGANSHPAWKVVTPCLRGDNEYLIQYSGDVVHIKDVSTGKVRGISTKEELMKNPPDLSAYNLILSSFKFTN